MSDTVRRGVTIERRPGGQLQATNERGGTIGFGTGGDADFTPTELLLAAIGGCTAIDVAVLTARRAEPESFHVQVSAEKIRDEDGNRLRDIEVTFHVRFPDGAGGDAARNLLPGAVKRSHDRLCTVGRTVELGTAITARVE